MAGATIRRQIRGGGAQLWAVTDDSLTSRVVPWGHGQPRGHCLANYTSNPLFRARLAKPPEEDMQAAVLEWVRIFGNSLYIPVSGPARGPGAGFTARLKVASSPASADLAHCPGGLPCRHENRIPHRRERRSVREVQGGHLF